MTLSDERWKDSYDAWKLASPYEEYDDDPREDDCDHEDYEADILTGRAICYRCGHAWWQTEAERLREIERERRHAEWLAEQERPWNRFKEWLRGKWLLSRARGKRMAEVSDDDIPF